jgi:protein tyrosine phosphatase
MVMPKYLTHSEEQIVQEYHLLHQFDIFKFNNSIKDKNHQKENRYSDVVPYLDSIVKLKPSEFTNDGYINANFINLPDENIKYIAAQGPLKNTVYVFLQMVLEQIIENDLVNIIMLTELYEGNREKCYDYISNLNKDIKFVFNKFGIDVKFKGLTNERNNGIEIREFEIFINNKIKIIRHIWIRKWPDFGIPNKEADNNYYLIKKLHELDGEKKRSNIVHCSAGVGRSGTFICFQWYYENVFMKNVKVKGIYEIVLKSREDRVMMVQRIEQYEYLYKAIKAMYIERKKEIN